ncbi:MAG: hypothetical protein HYV07_17590 [Deltaproteobacteria bacterium]|nr:hypothetical protein [Deltaproteobacteria bacterium]
MFELTISDLVLGLRDLLEVRADVMASSAVAGVYRVALEKKLRELEPFAEKGPTSSQPLAAALAEADAEHDSAAGAIRGFLDAQLRFPGLPADRRAQVTRLIEELVPDLLELRAPYSSEAVRAKARRKTLAALKVDLESFRVGDQTLADWAETYVAAGERLGTVLGARASQNVGLLSRAALPRLRGETLGLLGRFRAALADEVNANSALPRNLDAQVFGLFDELARLKAARPGGSSDAAEGSDPEPSVDPEPRVAPVDTPS